MGGYVQEASSDQTGQNSAGVAGHGSDALTSPRTISTEADTASPLSHGAKSEMLHQMRLALDRSPAVKSQVALQRALDRSSAGNAQKRRGKPALQMKGMAIDDAGLRPAAGLSGGPPGVVQRKVETAGGSFDTTQYEPADRDGATIGANIKMTFLPKAAAPAVNDEKDNKAGGGTDEKAAAPITKTIGMIQTNRRTVMVDAHNAGKPERKEDLTEIEAARAFHRTHIDRRDVDEETGTMRQNNPVYQSAENKPETKAAPAWVAQSINDIPKAPPEYGQLWTSAKPNDPAILVDRPRYGAASARKKVVDEFETAAVVIAGPDQNTYLGSVKWGWESQGFAVALRNFKLGKQGNPSRRFLAAAKKWNDQELPTDQESKKKMPTIKVPIPGN